MSWRCRYFESLIYHKPLLDIYNLDKNCKWIQAPKSLMNDDLYNLDYPISLEDRKNTSINMLEKMNQYLMLQILFVVVRFICPKRIYN